MHTTQFGISGTARFAGADADVVLHRAASQSSTGVGQRTWIYALRVQTCFLPGAIVVVGALNVHALDGWISTGIERTSANGLMGLCLAVSI